MNAFFLLEQGKFLALSMGKVRVWMGGGRASLRCAAHLFLQKQLLRLPHERLAPCCCLWTLSQTQQLVGLLGGLRPLGGHTSELSIRPLCLSTSLWPHWPIYPWLQAQAKMTSLSLSRVLPVRSLSLKIIGQRIAWIGSSSRC